MAGRVTVTSTSDSKEAVDLALERGTPKVEKDPEPPVAEEVEVEEGADEDAEVEPEVEEEVEEPGAEDATGDEELDAAAAAPKPKKRSNSQERFDYLTWKANNERARREEAEAEVARLRATPPEPEAAPVFDKPRPKLEDFEGIEEWNNASIDWARESAEFVMDQKLEKRMGGVLTPEKVAAQNVDIAHGTRLTEYNKKFPGFAELVNQTIAAGVPATMHMAEHFRHSEVGPALMHYLAENPDECRSIAKLPVPMQIARLGRIEERIESGTWKPATGAAGISTPPVPKKKQIPPPEPITPGGGKGVRGASKKPDDMSFAEFKAWRQANGKSRR